MPLQPFESALRAQLLQLLLAQGEVDPQPASTPDLEQAYPSVAQSYAVDGLREFAAYPTASLGWMMYIGMALAQLWDDDWPRYARLPDLYLHLRTPCGYDLLDEHIRASVLHLSQPLYSATESLVQSCAELAYTLYRHQQFQPATEAAFRGYAACLHQLFLMGAAVQFRRLGYHMQPL